MNSKFKDILLIILIQGTLILLGVLENELLLSYVYTLVLVILSNKLLFRNYLLKSNLFVFHVYTILSILLFLIQRELMPDSFGFSGAYNGIGTDDSRFYAGLANNSNYIPSYALRFIDFEHSFVRFLRVLYPFTISHPMQIIIPNLLGITFIPQLTARLASHFISKQSVIQYGFIIAFVCPFILSQSLILMRDGWTATLTILGIILLFEKRFYSFIIVLAILSQIRLASSLLLLLSGLFFIGDFAKAYSKSKILFTALILLSVIILNSDLLIDYLISKGVSGIGREEFIEIIERVDSNSIIYKIYSSPIYFKIPIGFIFFLFLPYLRTDFFFEGILNIRGILFMTLFPIISLFYFRNFLKNYWISNTRRLFYIYCFLLLILSQFSLQPRHKLALIPIFYVLVATGSYYSFQKFSLPNIASRLLVIFLFILQIFLLT